MSRARRRKCRNCKALFHPEPRNAYHQCFCSQNECRTASKRAAQRKWSRKPANQDYFRGPAAVERTRRWRAQRRSESGKGGVLQDVKIAQPTVTVNESGTYNSSSAVDLEMFSPLQDVLLTQPPVLLGLIATLTGTTLQDDIALFYHQLLSLGLDVMKGGSVYDRQNAALP